MSEINSENLGQIIQETINNILSSLFSSINNNFYEILDNITFISSDIINDSYFKDIFGFSAESGILLIANSLLTGFVLYYAINLIFSYILFSETQRPLQYIFRLIIFLILMNSSYFICEQILNLNSTISLSIRELGESIYNKNISFSTLFDNLNNIITTNNSFNLFSVDGLIKSFIYISLINILLSYSLRYIMIKVFILICPFAILTLINKNTNWFFKTWLKSFISLLLLQVFISLVLLIVFSINFSDGLFSKILYIGGLYALMKSNILIKELLGGISTNFSQNLYQLKYLFGGTK